MNSAAPKRNQSFRLSTSLIERLKESAQRQNRSLNNYVETILLEAAYNHPNADTIAAMAEAQSGLLRNAPAVDLSSIDAMDRSLSL